MHECSQRATLRYVQQTAAHAALSHGVASSAHGPCAEPSLIVHHAQSRRSRASCTYCMLRPAPPAPALRAKSHGMHAISTAQRVLPVSASPALLLTGLRMACGACDNNKAQAAFLHLESPRQVARRTSTTRARTRGQTDAHAHAHTPAARLLRLQSAGSGATPEASGRPAGAPGPPSMQRPLFLQPAGAQASRNSPTHARGEGGGAGDIIINVN